MRLLSIQVGKPRSVEWRGKQITTGIYKDPVTGPVEVSQTNLAGDGQADLTVHGGVDKAVYAYGWDSFSWWKERKPDFAFTYGVFGENLSLATLDESRIAVGDIFEIGTARLQASEPRFPCFKLGIRFGDDQIIETFTQSGRPGVYFRVLQPGVIEAGDTLRQVEAVDYRVTIREMAEIGRGKPHRAAYEKLLAIPSLSTFWREKLTELVAGLP